MRCPRCDAQFDLSTIRPAGPVEAGDEAWAVALCDKCRIANSGAKPGSEYHPEVSFLPHSSEKRKSKSRPLKDSGQSVAAARAVARGWREIKRTSNSNFAGERNPESGKRRWRIDGAHNDRSNINNADSLRSENEDNSPDSSGSPSEALDDSVHYRTVADRGSAPIRSAIAFGLCLFLGGQIAQIWAFIAGHGALWCLGNLGAIGGICFALLSVSEAFRRQQMQINRLHRTSGNGGQRQVPAMILNRRQFVEDSSTSTKS